jgi:hypothetical protein
MGPAAGGPLDQAAEAAPDTGARSKSGRTANPVRQTTADRGIRPGSRRTAARGGDRGGAHHGQVCPASARTLDAPGATSRERRHRSSRIDPSGARRRTRTTCTHPRCSAKMKCRVCPTASRRSQLARTGHRPNLADLRLERPLGRSTTASRSTSSRSARRPNRRRACPAGASESLVPGWCPGTSRGRRHSSPPRSPARCASATRRPAP